MRRKPMSGTRGRARTAAERPLCCEVSEMLSRWQGASKHFAAVKREILLFMREVVERELEALDRPLSKEPRRRRVRVRQV